jgi:hypothetical protein
MGGCGPLQRCNVEEFRLLRGQVGVLQYHDSLVSLTARCLIMQRLNFTFMAELVEWKGCRRKWSWSKQMQCPSIFLACMRKPTINTAQYMQLAIQPVFKLNTPRVTACASLLGSWATEQFCLPVTTSVVLHLSSVGPFVGLAPRACM